MSNVKVTGCALHSSDLDSSSMLSFPPATEGGYRKCVLLGLSGLDFVTECTGQSPSVLPCLIGVVVETSSRHKTLGFIIGYY